MMRHAFLGVALLAGCGGQARPADPASAPASASVSASATAAVTPTATALPQRNAPNGNECMSDTDCGSGKHCACPAAGVPGPNGHAMCGGPSRCYAIGQTPIAMP